MNCKSYCKFWMLLLLVSIPSLFSFSSTDHSDSDRHLQQILDALWEAKGDFRFKKPTIQLSEAAIGKAAYFMPSNTNLIIEIEEKAYNICLNSNNPNATLSIIIGHELAHYFQNPILVEGDQCSFASDAFSAASDETTTKKAKEIDADYKGTFNAYLANYDIKKYASEILDLLYMGYDFNQSNEYQSLEQRKQIAEQVLKKTDKLIALYEAGNHFYAIGNYPLAIAAYKKILADYPAKEIYNNLGVAYALESLRYAKKGELKFIYPIEIDARSKLKPSQGYAGKSPEEIEELRKRLLSNAFANFDLALQFDPTYKSAMLNKACALSMKGYADPEEPAHQNHLKEVKDWHFYSESILLEGIRAGLNGDATTAASKFREVIASNREQGSLKQIAQANLAILANKEREGGAQSKNCEDFYAYDDIELVGRLMNEQNFPKLSTYDGKFCSIVYKEDHFGTKQIIGEGKISGMEVYARMTVTNNTQYRFSDRIGVGDSQFSLDEFHCNKRLAETNDGYFQLFDGGANSYLFKIDDYTGLIRRWGVVSSNSR